MPTANPPIRHGSSAVQGPLWSARARDWAEVQEPTALALYQDALFQLHLTPGLRVLDAGCGAGVFAALAYRAGARVTGCDAAPGLIAIARLCVPFGEFHEADLEQLPFADESFDVVTGFNSFQYAATPVLALHEAYRVLRQRGRLVMATWGRPEECDATAYLRAVASLLPPPPPGAPGPFALSPDGAMAELTRKAGFMMIAEFQASTLWDYPDESTALRGLLSAGPTVRAVHHVGEETVRQALAPVLAKFRRPSGRYQLRNVFRYVLVQK